MTRVQVHKQKIIKEKIHDLKHTLLISGATDHKTNSSDHIMVFESQIRSFFRSSKKETKLPARDMLNNILFPEHDLI